MNLYLMQLGAFLPAPVSECVPLHPFLNYYCPLNMNPRSELAF